MPPKPKKTKVIHRPLGKERAYGIAHIEANKIEIDTRIKTRKYLEILLHEKIHLMHPEWSETAVIKESKELSRFLWDNHYRWVELI